MLKTGRNSFAIIEFSNGNRFRVLARTTVKVTADVRNPKFKRLQLARGRVEVELDNFPKDQHFSVETPTAVCGAVGTRFVVEYMPMEKTTRTFLGLFRKRYTENENRFVCSRGKIYARSDTFDIGALPAGTGIGAIVETGRENSFTELRVTEGRITATLPGGNRIEADTGTVLRTAHEQAKAPDIVALCVDTGVVTVAGHRVAASKSSAIVLKNGDVFTVSGVRSYVDAARVEGRIKTELAAERTKPKPDAKRIAKLESELRKAAAKATRLRHKLLSRNMRRLTEHVRRIRRPPVRR